MTHEDLVGHRFASYEFPVERGKIMEFSQSVLADNAVHYSMDVAKEQGYVGVLAPPTFSAVSSHWHVVADQDDEFKLDLERVLAAGAEWEYFWPIAAGDVLTVSGRVVSVEHKTGRRGGMTLITRANDFVNQNGILTMTVQSTVIELDAKPADQEKPA